MIKQSNGIEYLYDNSGECGIIYNSVPYFYRKNAQGDVISIHNTSGVEVASYIYDAWGNHKVYNPDGTENTNSTFIGNINPFRYRGYYFDTETNLYYLNSRYYDPQIGRFINADDVSYLDLETINGLNLYAYCGNNPVNLSDSTGCSPTPWWQWLIAGVVVAGLIVGSIFTGGLLGAAFIGAAIGGGISLGTQAISGELNWGQFALDIGVGALTGMLGMSGISKAAATFIGAGIGGVSNIASQLIGGTPFGEINWWSVGISAAVGGLAGFIGGAGARNARTLNSSTRVSKAINSVNKVFARTQSGIYYSSARYAQAAFTNVSNRLGGCSSKTTAYYVFDSNECIRTKYCFSFWVVIHSWLVKIMIKIGD